MTAASKFITLSKVQPRRGSAPLQERVFHAIEREISHALDGVTAGKPLVFDLFGISPIPKIALAESLIATLRRFHLSTSPFIFMNASREFMTSIRQPLLAPTARLAAFQLCPFIMLDGTWSWLGLVDSGLEPILNDIVRREFLTSSLADIHSSQGTYMELLKGLANANPGLLVEVADDNWFAPQFSLAKLLDDISTYERPQLTDLLLHHDLVPRGMFALPAGGFTTSCVHVYRIPLFTDIYERIGAQVARYVWATEPDVVVTMSLLSFLLGEDLRSRRGLKVLHAFGYPFPRPRYGEEVRRRDRVFILSDIYSSGASLNRLRREIALEKGGIVGTLSIVDAHGLASADGVKSVFSLHLPIEQTLLGSDPAMLLDPFSCMPFTPADRSPLPTGLLDQSVLWAVAEEKKAIRQGHWVYNGNHFSIFIDARKILRDRSFALDLVAVGLGTLGTDIDLLVLPKNEGALLLAIAVQEYFRLRALSVPLLVTCARDHETKTFVLPFTTASVATAPSILVVDDGANTGSTLLGLHYALAALRPRKAQYLVFVDRLAGTDRSVIDTILGHSYHYLFHFPVPVYREWDCPVCLSDESQAYYHLRSAAGSRAAAVRAGGPRPLDEGLPAKLGSD